MRMLMHYYHAHQNSGLQTSVNVAVYPAYLPHDKTSQWLRLAYCRSSPNTNFSFWLSKIPRNTNHRWPPPNKSEISLSSYNKAPRTPDKCQPTHQSYQRSLGWNSIIFNNRWFLYCFLAIKKRFWMSNFMPKRQESTQLKHKGSKFMYLIWIQNDGKDLHVQTRKLSSCV